MSLTLMYITNDLNVALIAQKYGVDRIWVDLETLDKEERQKGRDSVKSHHTVSDIAKIKPHLITSEMLVRINHWNKNSEAEIEAVIEAGADMIMLPYWKTVDEVQAFITSVAGRCKTTLLLETKEAVAIVDEILKMKRKAITATTRTFKTNRIERAERAENTIGFDEIHIGLNDLQLSYGLTFMFELLTNGIVESLCGKFKDAGIPYGFGGIAKIGDGAVPAEKIILEHYRLGSTRAILSRTFCDNAKIESIEETDRVFRENMRELRDFEQYAEEATEKIYSDNKESLKISVQSVVKMMRDSRYKNDGSNSLDNRHEHISSQNNSKKQVKCIA